MKAAGGRLELLVAAFRAPRRRCFRESWKLIAAQGSALTVGRFVLQVMQRIPLRAKKAIRIRALLEVVVAIVVVASDGNGSSGRIQCGDRGEWGRDIEKRRRVTF